MRHPIWPLCIATCALLVGACIFNDSGLWWPRTDLAPSRPDSPSSTRDAKLDKKNPAAERRFDLPCTGPCAPGQSGSQPCGNCGQQSRVCSTACQWGEWSSCTGQGVCPAGDIDDQACGYCNTGTRSRTCATTCQWGSWGPCVGGGECAPGDTDTQPCPTSGTQERTCKVDCTWGAWSTCPSQCQVGQKICNCRDSWKCRFCVNGVWSGCVQNRACNCY